MFGPEPIFADRYDAGRRLAAALASYRDQSPLVLALPRGGVPVGFEVARALQAPLDVVFVRKIGAPGHPELGLGALVDGPSPRVIWNEEIMRMVAPAPSYLEAEQRRQLEEIERRRRVYRGTEAPEDPRGRTVIVVDDGIATGGTVRAALMALKEAGPRRLVLAVPVAPPDILARLEEMADEVVCLAAPEPFFAVGAHYGDFSQTPDEEVIDFLARARAARGGEQS